LELKSAITTPAIVPAYPELRERFATDVNPIIGDSNLDNL
jgi:hypothetical protein